MLVICAGMCRSGSTWQYQVACDLLERTGPGEQLGFLTPPEFDRVMTQPSCAQWRIVKTHDAHGTFASVLASGQARCLYSYRDLRDVAFSLAHKWSVPLRTAVIDRVGVRNCIANHAFWTTQPYVFIQRYEDWIRNPEGDVTRIALHLGIDLQAEEAGNIARRYGFDENRQRTEKLAERFRTEGIDLTDPQNTLLSDRNSLLHWNHIRTGEVGGWRTQATPEEIAVLARECGTWLQENGYEDHPAWHCLGENLQQMDLLALRLEEAQARHAEAAGRVQELHDRLMRAEAEICAEREANSALHAMGVRLRHGLEEAHRTLNGAWSCLPHRLIRWLRTRMAHR